MPVYAYPNPNTTTRQNFTNFYLEWPLPDDADPKYKHLFLVHQRLMKLLVDHPAMDPNRQQTYSTPANSKNKVYFMWDFVGRTFAILSNPGEVNPKRPRGEKWTDCYMRAVLAKQLILDDTGKLEAMNQSVGYNDDAGIEFTTEIKGEAEKLDDLPE